jgi:hypothetical protein
MNTASILAVDNISFFHAFFIYTHEPTHMRKRRVLGLRGDLRSEKLHKDKMNCRHQALNE